MNVIRASRPRSDAAGRLCFAWPGEQGGGRWTERWPVHGPLAPADMVAELVRQTHSHVWTMGDKTGRIRDICEIEHAALLRSRGVRASIRIFRACRGETGGHGADDIGRNLFREPAAIIEAEMLVDGSENRFDLSSGWRGNSMTMVRSRIVGMIVSIWLAVAIQSSRSAEKRFSGKSSSIRRALRASQRSCSDEG